MISMHDGMASKITCMTDSMSVGATTAHGFPIWSPKRQWSGSKDSRRVKRVQRFEPLMATASTELFALESRYKNTSCCHSFKRGISGAEEKQRDSRTQTHDACSRARDHHPPPAKSTVSTLHDRTVTGTQAMTESLHEAARSKSRMNVANAARHVAKDVFDIPCLQL
jgi:hypothetical protein